jgi:NAD(P)-dependent dehydrogenase (short-subunit alcohol dehydrogenase family)
MKYSINKKYVIITGASGLLGPYHAEALAESGFNLILVDLNLKKLKLLTKKLKKKFNKIKILIQTCDITSEQEILSLKFFLKRRKIFVSCLVNNADANPKMTSFSKKINSDIENYSLNRLKDELSVGIIGTFNCCKHFGSEMAKKRKGIIINISSDLGITAPDQRVYHKSEKISKVKNFKPIGYSISKHGIGGITKYLSTYWGHKNVRCNTLVLGAVLNKQPSFLVENVKKRIPLNRWADKTEYKKAIQFLANEENSYMTGQTLIIDGGRTIW